MTLLSGPRSPLFAAALLSVAGACSRPADGGPNDTSTDTGSSTESSTSGSSTTESSTSSAGDNETGESGETEGGQDGWACGEGPTLCAQRPIGINDTTNDGIEVQAALDLVLREGGWPIDWRIDGAGTTELKLSILDTEGVEVIQHYGVDECGAGAFASADCHGGFALTAPGHLESSDGRIDVDTTLHVETNFNVGGGYGVLIDLDFDAAENQGSLPEWVEVDGLSYQLVDFRFTGGFGVSEDPSGIYDPVWTLWANQGSQIVIAYKAP